LALNYYDGKLFYKNSAGNIAHFYGANNGPSFATANANGSLLIASSPNDTLSFAPANGITITACTSTKTVTIGDGITYALANLAYNQANAAYAAANTAVGSSAAAAFNQANLAYNQANAAYAYANSLTVSSSDTYARSTANAAYAEANSAYSLASSAYSSACTAQGIASTNFNAFTDTHGNTISGSTSQSVQFVAGNNVTIFANPVTSQITINSTGSGGGGSFPYIDLGTIDTSATIYGSLDLGSLS
jgi:hypothetical protein